MRKEGRERGASRRGKKGKRINQVRGKKHKVPQKTSLHPRQSPPDTRTSPGPTVLAHRGGFCSHSHPPTPADSSDNLSTYFLLSVCGAAGRRN